MYPPLRADSRLSSSFRARAAALHDRARAMTTTMRDATTPRDARDDATTPRSAARGAKTNAGRRGRKMRGVLGAMAVASSALAARGARASGAHAHAFEWAGIFETPDDAYVW